MSVHDIAQPPELSESQDTLYIIHCTSYVARRTTHFVHRTSYVVHRCMLSQLNGSAIDCTDQVGTMSVHDIVRPPELSESQYIVYRRRTSYIARRTSYVVRRPSVVPRDYISQEPPLELFRHHSTEAQPELVAKSTELGFTCNTPRHGIITAAVQPIRIFPLIWRFKTMHKIQTDLNRLTLVYMVPIYPRAAVQNRNSQDRHLPTRHVGDGKDQQSQQVFSIDWFGHLFRYYTLQ